MSTAEITANKAAFERFHEAANTGDAEVISKTIDELVAPDAVIRTPLPIGATGAEALKQVWAMLLRIYPDINLTVEDLIAEGTRSSEGRRSPAPTRVNSWESHQPGSP